MRNKLVKLFTLGMFICVYFLMFNLFYLSGFGQESIERVFLNKSYFTNENVGFGDNVEVKVFKDKLFWNVETLSNNDYKQSCVLVFGFIPLPVIIKNFNFFWLHAVVGLVCLIVFLKIILSSERGDYYEK